MIAEVDKVPVSFNEFIDWYSYLLMLYKCLSCLIDDKESEMYFFITFLVNFFID